MQNRTGIAMRAGSFSDLNLQNTLDNKQKQQLPKRFVSQKEAYDLCIF